MARAGRSTRAPDTTIGEEEVAAIVAALLWADDEGERRPPAGEPADPWTLSGWTAPQSRSR